MDSPKKQVLTKDQNGSKIVLTSGIGLPDSEESIKGFANNTPFEPQWLLTADVGRPLF